MIGQVQVVRTPRELERVRQLRREVFEAELGHDYGGLDDSVDDHSLVLMWTLREQVVASIRFTVRADGPLEDEPELALERWRTGGFADAEIGQCTRLVVTPALRGRGLVPRMTAWLYAEAARRGVELIFIDTSPALVAFYQRLGFRSFRPAYRHPILGFELHTLVLFMGDSAYFERIGSRLRALAPRDTAARARAVHQRYFTHGLSGGDAREL